MNRDTFLASAAVLILIIIGAFVYVRPISPSKEATLPLLGPITSHTAGSGVVEPEDPNASGLARYPDLPLSAMPQGTVPVKFIVEHRSALNEDTVSVRGLVIGALLGENACPSDRGMCARPWITLADMDSENRNKLYDLQVYVSESAREEDFPVGEIITLKIVVSGHQTAVVAWEAE